MSYPRRESEDVDVERVRFSWKALFAIVGAILTVLSAFKAADLAADGELSDVKTRVSVVEVERRHDDLYRARIQQQLDRLEEKVDRILERGR